LQLGTIHGRYGFALPGEVHGHRSAPPPSPKPPHPDPGGLLGLLVPAHALGEPVADLLVRQTHPATDLSHPAVVFFAVVQEGRPDGQAVGQLRLVA
jgi:hypothetical protein